MSWSDMLGFSMSQTSAFLIHPNANPVNHGNGLLAPRCGGGTPHSFLPDLPSQSPHGFPPPPGLIAGLESVSSTSGPSASRQQSTPSSSQSGHLVKRPRLGRCIDAIPDQVQLPEVDYSGGTLRNDCSLFSPPESINETKGVESKLKIAPSGLGGGMLGLGGIGGGVMSSGGCGAGGGETGNLSSQLKWQAHLVDSWVELCDTVLRDIPTLGFKVETDKGFNFSVADDSFVCQKKNHFQVTVAVAYSSIPKFVKFKDGNLKPIEKFSVHLHGVKFEQITSDIKLEQSKSDRTKNKFEPEVIDLACFNGESIKRTMCRLHFSETTQNNMRKRGKPNPDQKYFSLVVALHADTCGESYPVVAHVSERIIVRASNPGNFDNDCDYSWFKSSNTDCIYHHGRVGINTDKPDEALCVHGNVQVTGQILQASDKRIKKNIRKVKGGCHLEKVLHLQLYEYQLRPTANQPSSCKCSDSVGAEEHSAKKNTRVLDFPHDITLEARSTADIPVASSEGRPGEADTLATSTSTYCHSHSRATSEDSSVPCSCPRDDATGVMCSSEKSCDGHVTDSGRGGDGEGEGGERILGLLAQEVQQVLPGAVVKTKQDVELVSGEVVKNLMVVDKDQVVMETVGAVQDLHAAMVTYERTLRHLQDSARESAASEVTDGLQVQLYQVPSKSFMHQNLRVTFQVSATSVLVFVFFLFIFILFLVFLIY